MCSQGRSEFLFKGNLQQIQMLFCLRVLFAVSRVAELLPTMEEGAERGFELKAGKRGCDTLVAFENGS